MISKMLLVLAVLAVYVSYVFYHIPIPAGVQEPVKLRTSLATNTLIFKFFGVLDALGIVRDYEAQRWLGERRASQEIPGVDMSDTTFNGVPVRVYVPSGSSVSARAMVHYHGGGWVLGSVNTDNKLAGYFAREGNMVVVSVGYRLTPEHSKNDGLDDCVVATEYFIQNADKFGVDPERVVIGGASAGGNYAAAVALRLRDAQFHPMPKIQLLLVPVLQAIDFQVPAYQQNRHGPHLTTQRMDWFYSYVYSKDKQFMSHFDVNAHVPSDVRVSMAAGALNHDILPEDNKYPPYVKARVPDIDSEIWHKIKDDILNQYSYPLMAKDLSNLPEAYIFTAQHDILRDDGYFYAHHLTEQGIKVTHQNCANGWHSMANYIFMSDVKAEFDKIIQYLNEGL